MQQDFDKRSGNIFRGVGYGVLLSATIVAFWATALSVLL